MMGKNIIATILLALLGGLTMGSAAAEELSGVIASPKHQAQKLELANDWQGLEGMAAKWTSKEGSNWESWYYYGLARLKLGKTEQALQALSTARKLSFKDNDVLLLLIADSHAGIGNWQEAEISYRELLGRYPNNADLWNKLRGALEGYLTTSPPTQQEVELALVDILEKLLAFGNYINNHELWQRFAALLDGQQRPAEARTAYANVLRLAPQNLQVVEWVFKYDIENADEQTLAETITHLGKISPDSPLLHLYQAEQALADNNKREARWHYEIVSENTQYPREQAQALAGLGDLTGGGRRGQALSYYKQAIQIDPSYLHAWEQIVVILRAQKKHSQAQQYFIRLRRIEKLVNEGKAVPRTMLHNIGGTS